MKWLKWLKRAVKEWCVKVRLYRELVKTIQKLQQELLASKPHELGTVLNMAMLNLIMPDYRQLDDELRTVKFGRMMKRLRV